VFSRKHEPASGRQLITQFITASPFFESTIGEYLNRQQVSEIVHTVDYHPEVILQSIYAKVAQATQAKIAGDKSPNDLDFAKAIYESGMLGGTIKIIHLVRDIRDVMVSLHKTGWLDDADGYFPRFWSNSNLYLTYKYRDKPDQYWILKYEDLVTTPSETTKQICDFLNVDYSDEMLDPDKRERRYQGNIFHENILGPIIKDRVGIYQKEVSPETESLYIEQAQEAMIKFGYLSPNFQV
jgi:hypothetical protein